MYCKPFQNTYGAGLEIEHPLPAEQDEKSFIYLTHFIEHTLAGGLILLEHEHLKSQ